MNCTAMRFDSPSDAKQYFDRHCSDGIIIDRIWECPACSGVHVDSHPRGASGASSGSSTRHLTVKIPAEAEVTNARLSRTGFKLNGRRMFRQ